MPDDRAPTRNADVAPSRDSAVRRVPARVGLVGNPSDGYGGAVLATIVPPLAATVTASRSASVTFTDTASGQRDAWPSIDAWRDATADEHVGPARIVSAALAALDGHARRRGGAPVGAGIELAWETTIPRSVGLAGSSALAVGVIDAAAAVWGVALDRRVVAALALVAERDLLGIAAGWQDRIVQAFATTVLVDTATMTTVDGVDVPAVTTMAHPSTDPSTVELVVGWSPTAASTSDGYHGHLRDIAAGRAEDSSAGRDVLGAMGELAALARRAHGALDAGDHALVADLVDEGWQRRQAIAPLRDDHAALVDAVRETGVAATTPGSGGAVGAWCLDGEEASRATGALDRLGVPWWRGGLVAPRSAAGAET